LPSSSSFNRNSSGFFYAHKQNSSPTERRRVRGAPEAIAALSSSVCVGEPPSSVSDGADVLDEGVVAVELCVSDAVVLEDCALVLVALALVLADVADAEVVVACEVDVEELSSELVVVVVVLVAEVEVEVEVETEVEVAMLLVVDVSLSSPSFSYTQFAASWG
jgi:hypothetical protein